MEFTNELDQLDNILAQLSGEKPKAAPQQAPSQPPALSVTKTSQPPANLASRTVGEQPPPSLPSRPKVAATKSSAPNTQPAQQRPTQTAPAKPQATSSHNTDLSSIDDLVSNLTNAFETLDAKNPSSGDDLSFSIMMLHSASPIEKESAIVKIVNLSVEEKGRQEIYQRDGIRDLTALLDVSNGLHICKLVAQGVSNLALNDACREAFGAHGAPQKLVKLLECNDVELSDKCLGALSNLCNNNEPNRISVGDALISKLPSLLNSALLVNKTLTAITNIVFNEGNQRKLVNPGTLPSITALLNSGEVATRSQACWIFAVLSTGPTDVQKAIYNSGALFGLAQTLPRASDAELEKILTVFVNLSNCDDLLDPIGNVGGVTYLLEVLKKPATTPQSKVLAAQALNNLTFSDACTLRIGDLGGGDTVVSILGSPSTPEKLLDITVRLTINLAVNATVRKQLNDKKAQDVLSRLSSHSSSSIQENVKLALQNLRAH